MDICVYWYQMKSSHLDGKVQKITWKLTLFTCVRVARLGFVLKSMQISWKRPDDHPPIKRVCIWLPLSSRIHETSRGFRGQAAIFGVDPNTSCRIFVGFLWISLQTQATTEWFVCGCRTCPHFQGKESKIGFGIYQQMNSGKKSPRATIFACVQLRIGFTSMECWHLTRVKIVFARYCRVFWKSAPSLTLPWTARTLPHTNTKY